MIIACPACNTRYVVPDSAIGVDGRTVRCAKCKHSWFQDGPEIAAVEPVPAPAPPAPPQPPPAEDEREADFAFEDEPRQAEPVAPEPVAAPADEDADDRAVEADDFAAPDFDETDPPYGDLPQQPPPGEREPVFDEEVSQFDYRPPFRPRRNYVKLWTWAAAAFAILALGAIAAVNYFGLPGWVPLERPLFAMAEPDLELEFPVEEQERRTLPDGTEFFGARIDVTNTARESRAVPPILIVLRDGRERIVYSWEVSPPQDTLAPGETMTINEAITDVPRSAVFADIGWAPR